MSPIVSSSGVDVDEDLESGFAESMDQQGIVTCTVYVLVHVSVPCVDVLYSNVYYM